MLNSLAAYILGGAGTTTDASDPPMRFTTVEADDWLLIDKECEDEQPLTDSEGEQRSSPPLPEETRNLRPVYPTRSSSPSPNRTQHMEESWFLTPPPCFTSQGPGILETSPLENLLIEHPSMSVYQHSSHYSMLESLELVESADSLSDSDSKPDVPEASPATVSETREARARVNRAASANRQQQKADNKNINKVQKARQPLKRSALERNNKAREVNARNARRRRADHAQAQRNSRANNNRKCC